MRATQEILDQSTHPTLTLDLGRGQVTVGPRSIAMEPRPLALYALFALQKLERCARPELPACGEGRDGFFSAGKGFPDDQRERLVRLYGPLGGRDAAASAGIFEKGLAETLRSLKSKANATIKRALGLVAGPYLLSATGRYAMTRHGLLLDKSRIRIAATVPGKGGRHVG